MRPPRAIPRNLLISWRAYRRYPSHASVALDEGGDKAHGAPRLSRLSFRSLAEDRLCQPVIRKLMMIKQSLNLKIISAAALLIN